MLLPNSSFSNLTLWNPFPHLRDTPSERYLMDLPENVMAESLDEIIRRSELRLEQQRVHADLLSNNGAQHTSARATLADGMQALKKLRAYRARFNDVSR